MSAVLSFPARQDREIGAVEAILGEINRFAMPAAARDALDRQAAKRRARSERNDLLRIYVWPTAAQVAFLVRARGMHAARERWHWVLLRELQDLARQGGAGRVEEVEA